MTRFSPPIGYPGSESRDVYSVRLAWLEVKVLEQVLMSGEGRGREGGEGNAYCMIPYDSASFRSETVMCVHPNVGGREGDSLSRAPSSA